MPHPAIDTWHHLVKTRNPAGLDALLAEDAVFLSPIVHSPQRGKALTRAYLHAAFEVFFNDSFRYVRELIGEEVVEAGGVAGLDQVVPSVDGGMGHGLCGFHAALRLLRTSQPVRARSTVFGTGHLRAS